MHHNVTVKGILSAKSGMNIYRGCTHGCIYCDSRSRCYHIDHKFEDIEVKENAVELLEQALSNKRKKCMVGTGAMTDPYIPLEKELQHMRKCLQVIDRYGFGFACITKSDLILRDMDLLKKINEKSKCVVCMTLTTADEELCKIIEPGVCTTQRRFEVLCRFRDAGIPTIVWLCPILPYINDTEENINGIIDMCEEAKVKGILNFGMGLTLREGSRDYYFENLDKHFPGLKQRYMREFGNSYDVPSPRGRQLYNLFRQRCRDNGFMYSSRQIFNYLETYEEKDDSQQLSLW